MRTIRIYQPLAVCDASIELSMQAAHHVRTVLRMKVGDVVVLFDGSGREFETIITHIDKKNVVVHIEKKLAVSKESPLTIHLAQGLSKGGSMEWVLQKSVELGVASITPVITQHCAVSYAADKMAKKIVQWQALVIAACEQCGRTIIPQVRTPQHFDAYVQAACAPLKIILDPYTEKTWRDYQLTRHIDVLIGPEGGFSVQETQAALKHEFAPLSLGPRTLRTETATITALSVLQALGGDL